MGHNFLPEIDAEACTGCGDCVMVCEAAALALEAGKVTLARPDRCEYDGRCEPVCPTGAIQLPYIIVLGA